MYADDLVLITQATRRVARNVNLCLSIYSFLTGQNPNLNKSSVYFPKWLNGKLGRGISKILGFSIGSFPFTYLGIAISPTRLLVSHFSQMVSYFQNLTSFWKKLHILTAGKLILINSALLSIPSYTLAVCHIPDTILDKLAKIAQNFLWHKDSDLRGLPLISWNRITLDKLDGDLAGRNLRHVHTAYFSINSLNFLNNASLY